MSVIRVNKDKNNPYLLMNKTGLNDERLSWKAKGLLAYLLSLPDDWKIYIEELSKHSKDGVKSTSSGIKELIENGYVERSILKDEENKFAGYEYVIAETPKWANGKQENPKRQATKYPFKLSNNKLSKGNERKLSFYELIDNYNLSSIEKIDDAIKIIEYYISVYEDVFKIKHINYTVEQWVNILEDIFKNSICDDTNIEVLKNAIDKHFSTKYKYKEIYYLHNFKDKVKDNRLYESDILCC
ncbi:helix-turn-helix domain-containing protein [Clostridium brassicae]|uniref:Helix-turn-helix domain-containing protein n=1 Tax=Clostridium brassicae TaxID=2999072 RepID=A0ABT4D6C8_9CLOT|nr:helix-turn-helix domain-containing protein [Clostridium brassicae]MCY6957854.1 hypothetical protein [Clostridium brassicae]